MKSSIKEDLKVEQECINICTNALQKMINHHWKQTSGDSVAEGRADEAVVRVLNYIGSLITK